MFKEGLGDAFIMNLWVLNLWVLGICRVVALAQLGVQRLVLKSCAFAMIKSALNVEHPVLLFQAWSDWKRTPNSQAHQAEPGTTSLEQETYQV